LQEIKKELLINSNRNQNNDINAMKNKIMSLEESTSHSQIKVISLKDNLLTESELLVKKFTSGLVTSEHLNEVVSQIESCILSSIEQKLDIRLDNIEKKFVEISKMKENNVIHQINDIYSKINEISTEFNKIYDNIGSDIGNKANKNDLHQHMIK
jgi:hypothetical protein